MNEFFSFFLSFSLNGGGGGSKQAANKLTLLRHTRTYLGMMLLLMLPREIHTHRERGWLKAGLIFDLSMHTGFGRCYLVPTKLFLKERSFLFSLALMRRIAEIDLLQKPSFRQRPLIHAI